MHSRKRSVLGKRILSCALALGMVVSLIPAAFFAERAKAADGSGLTITGNGSNRVVKGVVNDISELDFFDPSAKVGTAKRPFVILEVVPYEELGQFGYLINGCEPIKVEDMFGSYYMSKFANTFHLGEFLVSDSSNPAYFFPDEKEGQLKYYNLRLDGDTSPTISAADWEGKKRSKAEDAKKIPGYFEVVESGKGNFVVEYDDEDGIPIGIKKDSNGNIVWHTMNSFVHGYKENLFGEELKETPLLEVGDRFYTYRQSSSSDPYYDVTGLYKYYRSSDPFLTDTIGLTQEQADNYSIVVKTITPTELNSNPRWVDLADLIYVTPTDHDETYRKIWKGKTVGDQPLNRLNHAPGVAGTNYPTNGFVGNDLSWNVVNKIVRRMTNEEDYAALVLDNALYELAWGDCQKEVNFDMFDFNLDKIGTSKETGNCSNVYKMIIMTVSVNPNIIRNVFLDGGLIDSQGNFTLQSNADAKKYWADYEFQLVDRDDFEEAKETNPYISIRNFLESKPYITKYWKNYNYMLNFHTERVFVQGRTYTYNGDTPITQGFQSQKVSEYDADFDDMYTDFDEYVKTDEDTMKIWLKNHPGKTAQDYKKEVSGKTSAPSAALRYILGVKRKNPLYYNGSIRVLDIEPTVGLGTDGKPVWKLKKSNIRMMLPNFSGTITIDHTTMAAFIGRSDDLASTYDLIYMGEDVSGFYRDSAGRSQFLNDTSMNGKIYHHIGDYITVPLDKIMKERGVSDKHGAITDFVVGLEGEAAKQVRFPGNDITRLKWKELESFMDSGAPIVAVSKLTKAAYMDSFSYVWKFLQANNSRICGTADSDKIEDAVRNGKLGMKINSTPRLYQYVATGENNTYLDKNANGRAMLPFSFVVPEGNGKYSYKLYIDQDRNGKFEDTDLTSYRGTVGGTSMSFSYQLAKDWVGFVQWKLLVYNTANPNMHISAVGCSANKANASTEKNIINCLQIIPDSGNKVDLADSNWTNLYKKVNDFTINIWKMKYSEFREFFKPGPGEAKFTYNMGAALDPENNNPNLDVLSRVEANHLKNPASTNTITDITLGKINMIVIGFADMYGKTDLNDANGETEYLYYFAESGRSILFTHDLTSMFHDMDNKENMIYGYSANLILRDIMGINRYGMADKYLTSDSRFRSGLAGDLAAYRNNMLAKNPDFYDAVDPSKPQSQGFTYFNIEKKVGGNIGGDKGRNMYYYADVNPKTGKKISTMKVENCNTTKARRLNQGQITEYPFTIDENLSVTTTHAQYFQLNLEDPLVTVWYTLEDDNSGNDSCANGFMYGCSPQDAANNYYIYSKGNIFYSGVGHDGVTKDMERKLFVNTLIAAYRPKYEPPAVEILNSDAVLSNAENNEYTLRIPQEFNYDSGSNNASAANLGGDIVNVMFRPIDYSGSTSVKCRVYYDGNRANKGADFTICDKNGNPIANGKDENGFYVDMTTATDNYYIIKYAKTNMSDPNKIRIKFEVLNSKSPDAGFTTLLIQPQPLFTLD